MDALRRSVETERRPPARSASHRRAPKKAGRSMRVKRRRDETTCRRPDEPQSEPLQGYDLASPTVSAILAPRCPIGLDRPIVVSCVV